MGKFSVGMKFAFVVWYTVKPMTNALASEISQAEYTGNSLDMALLSGEGLFLKITFFPRYCPPPPTQQHIMADNVLSWCTLWAATDCAALVINWIMGNIQAVTGRKCWLTLESVEYLKFTLWNGAIHVCHWGWKNNFKLHFTPGDGNLSLCIHFLIHAGHTNTHILLEKDLCGKSLDTILEITAIVDLKPGPKSKLHKYFFFFDIVGGMQLKTINTSNVILRYTSKLALV